MITLDQHQLAAARKGSRTALQALIKALDRPVYNLALRMLAHPADAEDATQEILIQIITHLGQIKDERAAGAWAFKLAMRHLVHTRKRSKLEAQRLTFTAFGADLEDGLEALPDPQATNPETQVMVEEVKIGCTLALLTCLSRPLRAAFILGEIFDLSDTEAAPALDITPAAFRQRLKRARALVSDFTQTHCGLVSDTAACQCENRVQTAERKARIQRGVRLFPSEPDQPSVTALRTHIQTLDQARRSTALMRSNPEFLSDVGARVLEALETDRSSQA